MFNSYADVAELVDAHVSGTCGFIAMGVQVSPSALKYDFLSMILLDITNTSDIIASKLGKIIERISPDSLDKSMVEEIVVRKMISSLQEEGLEGTISIVNGLNIENENMIINDNFKVIDVTNFEDAS